MEAQLVQLDKEQILKQHLVYFIHYYGVDSQAAKSRFSSSILFTLYMIMEAQLLQPRQRADSQAASCSLLLNATQKQHFPLPAQFSSRWYLCAEERQYALRPVSQKIPQRSL